MKKTDDRLGAADPIRAVIRSGRMQRAAVVLLALAALCGGRPADTDCPGREIRHGKNNQRYYLCDNKHAGCVYTDGSNATAFAPFGTQFDTSADLGFRMDCYQQTANNQTSRGTKFAGCIISGKAYKVNEIGVFNNHTFQCLHLSIKPLHRVKDFVVDK